MGVPSVCHWVTAWTPCFLFSLLLNFFTHYFLSSNLINNINECFRKEVRVTFADWLPPLSTSVKPHCLKSLHSSELQAVGHGTFCLLDAYSLSIQVEGYVDGWSWWGLNKHWLHRQRISDWEPWISGIIIISAVLFIFYSSVFPIIFSVWTCQRTTIKINTKEGMLLNFVLRKVS